MYSLLGYLSTTWNKSSLLADFQISPLWLVIKEMFIYCYYLLVLPLSQNPKELPFRSLKCPVHAGSELYVALFL